MPYLPTPAALVGGGGGLFEWGHLVFLPFVEDPFLGKDLLHQGFRVESQEEGGLADLFPTREGDKGAGSR